MRLYYKDITGLIKEPYRSRGRDYFDKRKVQIISVNESQAKSKVVGSNVYRVTLKHDGPLLSGTCSCVLHLCIMVHVSIWLQQVLLWLHLIERSIDRLRAQMNRLSLKGFTKKNKARANFNNYSFQ